MGCTDYAPFAVLFMVCGITTLVFAHGRQELNGHCQIVNECKQIGYYCARNRTCQCRPGYVPDENWSKCIGFVGSKCLYDDNCILGAYCRGPEGAETCKCREQDDFYLSEDGQTCTSSSLPISHKKLSVSSLLILTCISLYLNT